MKNTVLLAPIVLAFLLSGCDTSKVDDKPAGVIPEHQMQALKKAQGVEATLLQADKKRQESME